MHHILCTSGNIYRNDVRRHLQFMRAVYIYIYIYICIYVWVKLSKVTGGGHKYKTKKFYVTLYTPQST